MLYLDPYTGLIMETPDQFEPLSAGITLEQIIESFTEPGKQFQFPVQSIPVSLDKPSIQALYTTAGIVTVGGIVIALILRN